MPISALRKATGAKSDAQIRQWRYGYGGRVPNPAYCLAIERATGGQVTRRDLRPNDCEQIWPDLANEIQQPQKESV